MRYCKRPPTLRALIPKWPLTEFTLLPSDERELSQPRHCGYLYVFLLPRVDNIKSLGMTVIKYSDWSWAGLGSEQLRPTYTAVVVHKTKFKKRLVILKTLCQYEYDYIPYVSPQQRLEKAPVIKKQKKANGRDFPWEGKLYQKFSNFPIHDIPGTKLL